MNTFSSFLNHSAATQLAAYKSFQDDHWKSIGEKMALDLFKKCAARVPAYKDFLARNGVDPAGIMTMDDFSRLPITSKSNYIKQYPLEQLCLDGKIASSYLISSSSGSTGQPTYWPRSEV